MGPLPRWGLYPACSTEAEDHFGASLALSGDNGLFESSCGTAVVHGTSGYANANCRRTRSLCILGDLDLQDADTGIALPFGRI